MHLMYTTEYPHDSIPPYTPPTVNTCVHESKWEVKTIKQPNVTLHRHVFTNTTSASNIQKISVTECLTKWTDELYHELSTEILYPTKSCKVSFNLNNSSLHAVLKWLYDFEKSIK